VCNLLILIREVNKGLQLKLIKMVSCPPVQNYTFAVKGDNTFSHIGIVN